MGWQDSQADIKSHWDENGWVAVRGFLDGGEVAGLRKEIDRYIEEVVPTVPEYEVMYDVKGQPETLKRLGHMSKYDEYFSDLIHTGKFTALAELLLDGEVVPQYCQLFNKPARVGVETPAHQDSFYIPLTPNEALTMWLALDTVDEGNGCLRYVSGAHKRPIRPHGPTEIFGFSQGVTDYGEADYAGEVPVPAEPGDVVIHHWSDGPPGRAEHERPRPLGTRLPSTTLQMPSRMTSCRKLGHATSRRNVSSGPRRASRVASRPKSGLRCPCTIPFSSTSADGESSSSAAARWVRRRSPG